MVNLFQWSSDLLRMLGQTMQTIFDALSLCLTEIIDLPMPDWLGELTLLQVVFGGLLLTIIVTIAVKWALWSD